MTNQPAHGLQPVVRYLQFEGALALPHHKLGGDIVGVAHRLEERPMPVDDQVQTSPITSHHNLQTRAQHTSHHHSSTPAHSLTITHSVTQSLSHSLITHSLLTHRYMKNRYSRPGKMWPASAPGTTTSSAPSPTVYLPRLASSGSSLCSTDTHEVKEEHVDTDTRMQMREKDRKDGVGSSSFQSRCVHAGVYLMSVCLSVCLSISP
jgi:hypothetical protein